MRPPAQVVAAPATAARVFATLAGVFLFITVVKFGNPVILESTLTPPETMSDFLYDSWPSQWGIRLLLPVLIAGLFAIRWERLRFRWFVWLPAAWLGWEFFTSAWTVNPPLSAITLRHFEMCVGLFYLGYFAWDRDHEWPVWVGLGLGICYAMRSALQQHFGGLEATIKLLHNNPNASGLDSALLQDPDFIKRMAKMRVFGTFFYPNTLAGGLLLLLPMTMAFVWQLTPKVRPPMRVGFVLILGGCGLACLYWSGSKAGWLVALVIASCALWHSTIPKKWKVGIISGVLVLGLAGFAMKYASFFSQQRNSVGARFQYWEAACQIVARHPLVGTGPGTFGPIYNRVKPIGAEPAKLCHNDYLEQASDSGIPGAFIYVTMILTLLTGLYRYSTRNKSKIWLDFAIWMGLFALALHMLVEFHLYIAALAWPMFFVTGGLSAAYVNVKPSRKGVF